MRATWFSVDTEAYKEVRDADLIVIFSSLLRQEDFFLLTEQRGYLERKEIEWYHGTHYSRSDSPSWLGFRLRQLLVVALDEIKMLSSFSSSTATVALTNRELEIAEL